MTAVHTTTLPTTFVQSPSIEDLLSARSKRSAPLATHSMYSTFTTATEFDLPEAARLAMQEESANGVWSPSLASTTSDDDRTEREGLATPNMSESDYSRSPSVASVRMAAIVQSGPARSFEYSNGVADRTTQPTPEEPVNTSPKRILNARNLFINTALSAPVARPYPGQSTTPTGLSAHIEIPSVPLTSRSLPGTSITIPPMVAAPLTALPPHITRPRRRSSLDSYASSLASPVEEDITLGINQASLQRMQSFLGPKMKHISPAPWSNENASEVASDFTSDSSFWNDEDPEIGLVQMATKTPRSRSVKEALGFSVGSTASKGDRTASGLKGLVFAVGAETTSPTSRPSMASERSTKSRTNTASSDTSKHSGAGGKFKALMSRSESRDLISSSPPPVPTNAKMTVSNIIRSKTPDVVTPSASQTAFLDLAQVTSASAQSKPESDNVLVPISTSTSRRRSLSNIETSASKQNLAALSSSTPAGSITMPAASASTTVESVSSHASATHVQSRKPVAPTRKRPPVYHQDSTASVATVDSTASKTMEAGKPASSMSMTSLSDPINLPRKAGGAPMALISLDAARERERRIIGSIPVNAGQRSPISPTPSASPALTAIPPPLPPNPPTSAPKALKSKKSGFLRYFKQKEDPHAPAVPRTSSDETTPLAVLMSSRSVSNPTDFRRGDTSPLAAAFAEAASNAPTRVDPVSAMPKSKSRTNSNEGKNPKTEVATANHDSQEASCRANTSAPPAMAIVTASPDLADTQASFPPAHVSKAKRVFADSQGGLVPSLSLRPVSMMFNSMPQAFLADSQAVETRKHGLKPGSFAIGAPSPDLAHASETPSFVFLDADNVVTPPSISTSNSHASKTPFGLPTPPHSASSASRTFSTLSHPPPPVPPIMLHESDKEAVSSAAYRARILLLEKQIRVLHMQLDSGRDGKENDKLALEPADLEIAFSKNGSKICDKCGCSCRTSSASVLSRPRVVGHGSMFSSGRG